MTNAIDDEELFEAEGIRKIQDELNRGVRHMSAAITNIEQMDAVPLQQRMDNPAWRTEMEGHQRHLQNARATVEHAAWLLELAQRGRSEKAQTKLSGRLNCFTAAIAVFTALMAIAVVVQAVFAWLVWRCPGGRCP